MITTDHQVRKLMREFSKHSKIGQAALAAGLDRKTASKYIHGGQMPSELRQERQWRTRSDPFVEDWREVEQLLEQAPELEAKTLFEYLCELRPDCYHEGQLRTLQRRVRAWRASFGPPKEVFFPQEHRPGEAMQTDFTDARELGITILGEPLAHFLCHGVLPFSNWQWATVCRSECFAALKRQVQAAVFALGRVPRYHQTDSTTAVSHHVPGGRELNQNYRDLLSHFGMQGRLTAIGEKEQNGDVEALNGALKGRLKQHLLLRGTRDFDSVDAYEKWVQDVLGKVNGLRRQRLTAELDEMRPLTARALPLHTEVEVSVSRWSTIQVKYNTYSVPSRLIGERVQVRIFAEVLEVHFGGRLQERMERLSGRGQARIQYRHIIWSLVKKPGAFARYRYRQEMFPTLSFRRSYDRICERGGSQCQIDLHYLRILHLAASTMESEVETALELLLEQGETVSFEAVRSLVVARQPEVPQLPAYAVDLSGYDELLAPHLQAVSS